MRIPQGNRRAARRRRRLRHSVSTPGSRSWSGGFVGVDVFFVLSGYLITSIILKDLARRHVLACSLLRAPGAAHPAGAFPRDAVLPAIRLDVRIDAGRVRSVFSKSLITAALSVSNFYFWRKSRLFRTGRRDFAAAAHLEPRCRGAVLPAVSAARDVPVAEAPGEACACARRRRPFASLLLSQWTSLPCAGAGFYMLPTRAWELLAGALVALRQRPLAGRARRSDKRACCRRPDADRRFRSSISMSARRFLPSTLSFRSSGTMLVLRYARSGTWTARLLSLPLVRRLGLISYSAYLWHQPVLAFLRISRPDVPVEYRNPCRLRPDLRAGLSVVALC